MSVRPSVSVWIFSKPELLTTRSCLTGVLSWIYVKGQNPKAQPSTLKFLTLRNFWKIIKFKNPKRIENSLFKNKTFHPKQARQK